MADSIEELCVDLATVIGAQHIQFLTKRFDIRVLDSAVTVAHVRGKAFVARCAFTGVEEVFDFEGDAKSFDPWDAESVNDAMRIARHLAQKIDAQQRGG